MLIVHNYSLFPLNYAVENLKTLKMNSPVTKSEQQLKKQKQPVPQFQGQAVFIFQLLSNCNIFVAKLRTNRMISESFYLL